MRLGKRKEKEKDVESKNQVVEGINRLICLARSHPFKCKEHNDILYCVCVFYCFKKSGFLFLQYILMELNGTV